MALTTAEKNTRTGLIVAVVILLLILFWEPLMKALGIQTSGAKTGNGGSNVGNGNAINNPTYVGDDGKGKCTVYKADGSKIEIEGDLNDPQFQKLCRDSNLPYYQPMYYYGVPYYNWFFIRGRRHHGDGNGGNGDGNGGNGDGGNGGM